MKKFFTTLMFMLANVLASVVPILVYGRFIMHWSYEDYDDLSIIVLLIITLLLFGIGCLLENRIGNTKKNKWLQRIRWYAGAIFSSITTIALITTALNPNSTSYLAPGATVGLLYSIPALVYFTYRFLKMPK